ncbi:MAG: CHAT domain-containing protein [Acetobacteraceae bacterium]|nr:CHAT domain-containing protein [Acetobacteraceae bacterium]
MSDLPAAKALDPAIDEILALSRLLGTRPDAQALSLMAGRPGTDPRESARLLAQASEILQSERHSFFDARRRGTVMEGSTDIPLTLAMQYLSLHMEAEAFDAFESVRSRGLGELNQVLDRSDTTDETRRWLASVLALDARASRIETQLVERVSATGDPALVFDKIDELQAIRQERESLIGQGGNDIARLRAATYQPAHLADLETATRQAGVPVMLYWSNTTSLVAWYVGPHGSEVRNIFLPAAVLQDAARKIRNSVSEDPSSVGKPFDDVTARELYLFLIAPFERLLDGSQIIIVPEGPLVDLPFETLLMAGSDRPLIERWAVSYAPNATLALRALREPLRPPSKIDAVIDPDIDNRTKESAALRSALGPRLREVSFDSMITPNAATTGIDGRTGIHLLLHGRFDPIEPLLSELSNESRTRSITAAGFVALPLGRVPVAVLSGCETGQVGVRLSNEIYGFPWALLAGGVDSAVVSRWQVLGTSNEAWMRLFYSAVMGGQSPAQAGASAMRGLRAAGQPHPYYWAAMQITGR